MEYKDLLGWLQGYVSALNDQEEIGKEELLKLNCKFKKQIAMIAAEKEREDLRVQKERERRIQEELEEEDLPF